MQIPFTNIVIGGGNAVKGKRPLVHGRGFSLDPVRDMTGFQLNFNLLYSAHDNQTDIMSCVREWREGVGSAGYAWRDPSSPDKEVADNLKKELNKILSYKYSFRVLKSRLVKHLGITGNAFLAIIMNQAGNKALGVQLLDPRTISIVSDEYGNVYKYIQKVNQKVAVFEPSEVIHFKYDVNTSEELWGASPMVSAIWEIRTDISAMVSNYFFFDNDAKPSVQYILEEGMGKEEIDKAVELIKQQFGGAENRNKSGVVAGVKEIKTIAVSQKDMEFLLGRKLATEKICSAFGVPKFMLGYTDEVNNNNGIELRKGFFESTIFPLEELIAETINRELILRLGLEGQVEYEFLPNKIEDPAIIEKRALEELKNGAITLRQYKIKTGQKITEEDENTPNFDSYIIHSGASAILLEDAGVDPVEEKEDPKKAKNFINSLQEQLEPTC